MNKNIIVAIVLGLLVLIAVVQAFQLNTLKTKLGSGELSIGAKSTGVTPLSTGGGGGALPSNIQNLPTMVGGC